MERIGYKIVLNFANFYGVEVEKREINGIMEEVLLSTKKEQSRLVLMSAMLSVASMA